MNGMTVEMVASSWIDALGGLSRWVTCRVPPAFWAWAIGPPAATNSIANNGVASMRLIKSSR